MKKKLVLAMTKQWQSYLCSSGNLQMIASSEGGKIEYLNANTVSGTLEQRWFLSGRNSSKRLAMM